MHFFKVAKNTFYQIVAKLFSSLAGFLITIIIARFFGIFGYGDFIKITSFVAPFYLIADFGLNAFYLKLKEDSANYPRLFWLRIYLSLAAFLLVNVINMILPYNVAQNIGYSPTVKFGIFLFSMSVFSQAIIYSASAFFQQKLKYFYYMLSIIIGSVVNLVLVFIFSFMKLPINAIIIAFVIAGFFTALFASIFVKVKITRPTLKAAFSKSLLKTSSPLALMLIFNLVYFRVDSIILAFLKSTSDVGIYGLAYKFFDFLIALPLFLSNSLYPLLLENQKNLRNLNTIVRNYSLIFIISGVLIAVPFWFLAPFFTIIKNDFIQSVFPFRILLLSLPLFFISSFLQWILISFGKQKYLALIYFFSTILNVSLNVLFIPKYTYVAAAYITIISEALVVVLLSIKLIHLKNIRRGVQT